MKSISLCVEHYVSFIEHEEAEGNELRENCGFKIVRGNQATTSFQPIAFSMKARSCDHHLYDSLNPVDPELHAATGFQSEHWMSLRNNAFTHSSALPFSHSPSTYYFPPSSTVPLCARDHSTHTDTGTWVFP